jgi:predicted small secreted protein
MMIKKVAAIVALVMIASLSIAGCTNSTTNTGTGPSPSPSSDGISDVYLSVLTTNLEKGGYTTVTPFTKTTENGKTIYVAAATKGGDTFALTYYPASSSSDALSIQQQQINKYIGQGYVKSIASTSTEWIGLLSTNQGIGVQLLDISPVGGVLLISGTMSNETPIVVVSPVPTPAPTPTPQPLPTQASVSGPMSFARGQKVTFTATLYSVNEHKNVCGAVNYYVDNSAAGGTWNINPSGSCSASAGSLVLAGTDTSKLSPGTHTLKVDWLGNNEYGPSQAVMTFTVLPN